ncbi:MAG: DUF2933 domain-containing protein [Polaromonas sp.]|uniref:DUF2933 domain-containing protein n=1 Tax=Polaromonas sp. TaxID=1869339 RepID=UPI002488AEF3|nr:DUF2933 domain-containing protein [Polaromonas sp.]MDI1268007.1 DUF2933 domain-containing protein [Polaromonas sp.]
MDPFDNDRQVPSFWRRPAGMAVATAALIAGFYLLREHWGHVLGYWPYLLLLACPLMHLMHGHGHGGHGHRRQEPEHTSHGKGS